MSSVEDSTEGSSSDSDVSSDASDEDGDTIKIDNLKDGVYVNEAYDGLKKCAVRFENENDIVKLLKSFNFN